MPEKSGKIVPLRLIFSHFSPHINKYKKSFYICFIGYGISYILNGTIKPLFYRDIMDVISSGGNSFAVKDHLIYLVKMIAVVVVIHQIIHRATDFAMVYCQSNIVKELRNYSFVKFQNHSYQFFVNNFQGSLVEKANRFKDSFVVLHDCVVYAFWQAAIQLSGIFIVLFITSPIIGSFFAIWCIFFIGLTAFLVQKKRRYDLAVAMAGSRTTGQLADTITGILNIKMFASIGREKVLFESISSEEEKIRRFAWNFNTLIMVVHSIVWMILEIVGLYIVIGLWAVGSVSAGTFILTQTYFVTINGIMWNLRDAIIKSMRAVSDASEMVQIFERKPDILDPENPEICRITSGKIVFDDATFAYGKSITVFQEFNLVIEPGQKVGLVGTSGAGKTTITRLLLRFMDVVGGRITIDGQDIAKIRQNDLRDNIAYVPQDPVLFHRTLRENIVYGKPNATEEKIIEAAVKANAHNFISTFPDGYDTLVGERGVKLSGGERQRIAIARAMLKDAPILILDEATSSLDSISECSVQEAFSRLMENRTTIVIAHRLSTVRKMDRIIVLNDGEIAEEGTHAELLERKGSYYDFWLHQSDGFIV